MLVCLFDVRYYLVGILFIIFDLETAFMFPWAVELKKFACWIFLNANVSGYSYYRFYL